MRELEIKKVDDKDEVMRERDRVEGVVVKVYVHELLMSWCSTTYHCPLIC